MNQSSQPSSIKFSQPALAFAPKALVIPFGKAVTEAVDRIASAGQIDPERVLSVSPTRQGTMGTASASMRSDGSTSRTKWRNGRHGILRFQTDPPDGRGSTSAQTRASSYRAAEQLGRESEPAMTSDSRSSTASSFQTDRQTYRKSAGIMGLDRVLRRPRAPQRPYRAVGF